MTLRYALAMPACVIEDLEVREAIRRSIDLSKGARGRIFVLFLLIGVIKLGLVGITQAAFVVMVFKNHGQVSPLVSSISQVVAFFTNTFIGPIGGTGVALFYYDQRVRKEGYDIEWMMQAAGLTPPRRCFRSSSRRDDSTAIGGEARVTVRLALTGLVTSQVPRGPLLGCTPHRPLLPRRDQPADGRTPRWRTTAGTWLPWRT